MTYAHVKAGTGAALKQGTPARPLISLYMLSCLIFQVNPLNPLDAGSPGLQSLSVGAHQ